MNKSSHEEEHDYKETAKEVSSTHPWCHQWLGEQLCQDTVRSVVLGSDCHIHLYRQLRFGSRKSNRFPDKTEPNDHGHMGREQQDQVTGNNIQRRDNIAVCTSAYSSGNNGSRMFCHLCVKSGNQNQRIHPAGIWNLLGRENIFPENPTRYSGIVRATILLLLLGSGVAGQVQLGQRWIAPSPPNELSLIQIDGLVPIGTKEPLNIIQHLVQFYETSIIVSTKPINVLQCVEVLTTGTLSAVECNLPIHCGSVLYQKLSSTWYGKEVGLCFGLGEKPMSVRLGERTELPRGWDMSVDIVLTNTNFVGHQMAITYSRTTDYGIVSYDHQNEYAKLNMTSFEFIPPKVRQVQGHYCIPQIRRSDCPLRLTKLSVDRAKQMSVWVESTTVYRQFPSIMTNYTQCWHQGKLQIDVHNIEVACEALASTSNILPPVISSIPKTIANVIVTTLCTLWLMLQRLFYTILLNGSYVLDYPTFILALAYTIRTRTLTDSLLISLFLSVVATLAL